MPSLRRLAVVAVAATVAAALPAAPAFAGGRRAAVPAATWTAAAVDRGAASAGDRIQIEVALQLQDEQGAEDLATAVSTPGDPQYGHALAPTDWIARFAPTQADVDALSSAAADAGLTVDAVPASRLFVVLAGTVAEADAFFATRVHEYTVDGTVRLAAATAATLPRAVADDVAGVTFGRALIRSRAARAKSSKATACSATWGAKQVRIPKAYGSRTAGTPGCGYSAAQLRALSGTTGLTGAGQTVAVIDAFGSPTMRADLARYSARNGLPAADYTERVPAASTWDTSSSCAPGDWTVEQSMDLEAVHAVAPAAKLVYVGAADCGYGFDMAMSTVLDEGLASIVSNSWGSTGLDTLVGEDQVDDAATLGELAVNVHQHVQAAGEGVGLYFASGDSGDDAGVFGVQAVDFPASSPFVTAVGGTTSALDRHGKHRFSAPWGTNVAVAQGSRWSTKLPGAFGGGSGGGLSSLFTAPVYQRDVVPGYVSQGARAIPDVSADAAPETGMLVGWTATGRARTAVVGGTSLATPIVAAQVALAQQRAGRTLGFLNPKLYAVAASARDVAPSSTRRFVAERVAGGVVLHTVDRDSSLAARRGWDAATGVGELDARTIAALAR